MVSVRFQHIFLRFCFHLPGLKKRRQFNQDNLHRLCLIGYNALVVKTILPQIHSVAMVVCISPTILAISGKLQILQIQYVEQEYRQYRQPFIIQQLDQLCLQCRQLCVIRMAPIALIHSQLDGDHEHHVQFIARIVVEYQTDRFAQDTR